LKKGRYEDLKISDIRIRLIAKEDSKLKAIASMTIDDCFVVHDIKVLESEQGNFIAMPSKKTPNGEFKDIVHPLNSETREMISSVVLAAYEAEKQNPTQQAPKAEAPVASSEAKPAETPETK
jgi:stage V sporulation protein G